MGLGRLGFAGGLVRGSAARLDPIGRFRFGVKLTRGFHLMGLVVDVPLEDTTMFFFRDRALEEEAESRLPFWRVRAVYWCVTVGVRAPG